LLETVALFGGDFRRHGARGAELGELAALAEVEEVTPDFAAGRLGLAVGSGVVAVEGFEVRGIGEIVGGAGGSLVGFDEDVFFDGGALFDSGEETGGDLGVFDEVGIGDPFRSSGAVEEEEHVTEGIFDGGAEAAGDGGGWGGEFQLKLVAAAVEVFHAIDEVIHRVIGEVGIDVEDELGLAVEEAEAGEALVLLDELEADDVAIVTHSPFERLNAHQDSIDVFEHCGYAG
jgi:hypothetical protein